MASGERGSGATRSKYSQQRRRTAGLVVTLHVQNSAGNFPSDILIPNPTDSGWQKLEELGKFANADPPTEFECLMIPGMVSRIGCSVAWNVASWK